MRLLTILIIVLVAHPVLALTTISNLDSFPYKINTASETYQLSENIVCEDSCFQVAGSDMVVDLNGFSVTFGNGYNPGILDTDFEAWDDSSTLTNWTAVSGTVSQTDAITWGSYDATLSAEAVLKSNTVTLRAGKTYIYYAYGKGNREDAIVTSIIRASDGETLATQSITGNVLNRGFAMDDGSMAAIEQQYKPTVETDVYLQIECVGTASTKRLFVADLRPARQYGFVAASYQNLKYFPDFSQWGWGSVTNLTVKDGTIIQGAGGGVKSAAFNMTASATIQNVDVYLNGNNTLGYLRTGGDSLMLDDFNVSTTSKLYFNRMHPGAEVDLGDTTGGTVSGKTIEIKNSTFTDGPGMSIRSYGVLDTGETHSTVKIHHNVFLHKEQVTEGYAIAASGIYGLEIYNNQITPSQGRGILLDAVSSGDIDGSTNTQIHDNVIDVYEVRNTEYPEDSLEAVGLRIRSWGGTKESHDGLDVYDNTFTARTDADGVHAAYGIGINHATATDDIMINNNIFAIAVSGTNRWGAAIAVQEGNRWATSPDLVFTHNDITSNSYGIAVSGNDGQDAGGFIYSYNDITADIAPFRFGMAQYSGDVRDITAFCNDITMDTTTGYPFYFSGTVTGTTFDHNNITNSNANGDEVWAASDYSDGIVFCESGTIDVVNGSVGTGIAPCDNGSTGCYSTAGADWTATCSEFAPECDNQTDCETASWYWVNSACQSTPGVTDPTCDDSPTYCTTEGTCETAGWYWYDSTCNSVEETFVPDTETLCSDTVDNDEDGDTDCDDSDCDADSYCAAPIETSNIYKESMNIAGDYYVVTEDVSTETFYLVDGTEQLIDGTQYLINEE